MRKTKLYPAVKCPKCDYSWQPRVPHPKSCPECKTRLSRAKVAALLLACVLAPSLAHADALVISQASIDWTGLNFTRSGDLTFDLILPSGFDTGPRPVTAIATAAGVPGEGLATDARWDGAFAPFWFHASGTGIVALDVPYHLSVAVSGVEPFSEVYGLASASLAFGATRDVETLSWAVATDQVLTQSGILHVEQAFVQANPIYEPLTSAGADAQTLAHATVPEPPTWGLLLTGLGFFFWRRR